MQPAFNLVQRESGVHGGSAPACCLASAGHHQVTTSLNEKLRQQCPFHTPTLSVLKDQTSETPTHGSLQLQQQSLVHAGHSFELALSTATAVYSKASPMIVGPYASAS
ncbi:hypothetical protein Emed_007417 [Eimeria media]